MDVARPDLARKKRRRRILLSAVAVAGLAAVTLGLSQLKPAAPSVERSSLLTDTVKRGEMLRQVRGNGTLVPEQIQFVQSETEGRVERILVKPGAEVTADTVLLELSNPELKQAAFDAEYQLAAGEAQLTKLRVQLESDRLTQKAAVATLKSDTEQAQLVAQADANLAKQGLVPVLTAKQSRAKADDLLSRVSIEEERLAIAAQSATAQVAAAQAELEKNRALLALKRRQLAALRVQAGIDGVLQQVGDLQPLQQGQRISPSATLAKIVQPSKLKAEIKIAETQAKDVLIGQVAAIDTRNGVIPGRVIRVDPSVVNGTVTVDVKLEGALPRGARPDLSVDGVIELERLNDVLYVGRPVQSQADSTVGLFKVVDSGRGAVRIAVKFGHTSVSTIEVQQGLQAGDQIILNDMSAWDGHDRVKLN
ncbi:MAG TPA: efflux RND transporter periplasmic adaptor subunit [Candidatus Saccharimonadales bacterium]|nr:efflux RND transporter periplasmic adaptor subunit [Candidatus Saccharimonadales bacterium]